MNEREEKRPSNKYPTYVDICAQAFLGTAVVKISHSGFIKHNANLEVENE